MDELDTAIVALLADDARTPVSTLARQLGLARTTVQARLERLEKQGVIAGYTVRMGESSKPRLRATALVSVEPKLTPKVVSRLKDLPQVQIVHSASGRYNLIVEVATNATDELDDTLDQIGEINGVSGTEHLIHLSTKIDRELH